MHEHMRKGKMLFVVVALLVWGLTAVGCGNGSTDKPATKAKGSMRSTVQKKKPAGAADTTLEAVPGATWEMTSYVPGKLVPISFPLAGPWEVRPQAEAGWNVVKTPYETVAIVDTPEGSKFPKATYALKTVVLGAEAYLPRSVENGSVVQWGSINKQADGTWAVQDFGGPNVVYPLDMEPGDKRQIFEDAIQRIEGEAIARSSIKTPVGIFNDALLLRFDYTKKKNNKNNISTHHYFVYAPEVGLIAQIDGAPGQQSGVDISQAIVMQVITKKRQSKH